ncbi:hypothetical protein HK102_010363, partial [Quaeritorhiza haematococci]
YWSVSFIERHLRTEVDFLNEARNSEKASSRITSIPSLSSRCDPHPGNLLVRRNPTTNTPQLVLLDHGLYMHSRPTFRHNYALFWTSLFTADLPTLQRIAQSWGIADVEMFASSTLQKPWSPSKAMHVKEAGMPSLMEVYELQVQAKERVKRFLSDTEKTPLELVFIGRNLNIIRSNNKTLGSPVNRINIMAHWAAKALGDDWSLWEMDPLETSESLSESSTTTTTPIPSLSESPVHNINTVTVSSSSSRSGPLQPAESTLTTLLHTVLRTLRTHLNYFTFRTTLFLSASVFYANRLKQKVRWLLFGDEGVGFEEILDRRAREMIYEQFGVVLDESAFDA